MHKYTMIQIISIAMLMIALLSMPPLSAESISDGEHVVIYDDGAFAAIAKATKKELTKDLKGRKIKWTVKSKKGGSIADLEAGIEKDVIKKKPDIVVLSFGMNDLYDVKKQTAKEHDVAALVEGIGTVVSKLQSAGVRVILVTPGIVSEDLADPSQEIIETFAEALRTYAKENTISVCDVRKKVVSWLGANPPKKKGRRQLSKKGGKWTKEGAALLSSALASSVGLSKSGIGRAIKWDERVVFYGHASKLGIEN